MALCRKGREAERLIIKVPAFKIFKSEKKEFCAQKEVSRKQCRQSGQFQPVCYKRLAYLNADEVKCTFGWLASKSARPIHTNSSVISNLETAQSYC
jgi:hypothetical protein